MTLSRVCEGGVGTLDDGGSHTTYPSISSELAEVAFRYNDVDVEYSCRIRWKTASVLIRYIGGEQ